MPRTVELPAAGVHFVPVDRAKMKAPADARRMKSVAEVGKPEGQPLPPAPPALDLSQGRTVPYPILGNDEHGDCFMVSACKHVTTWGASVKKPATWTTKQVVDAYLELSPNDDGLSDSDIMAAWKAGLCHTDHKRLDYMVVPDARTARLAAFLFAGLQFTLALPDRWIHVAAPGATWDAQRGDRPNPGNGHAVLLSGYDTSSFNVETWGFKQPVKMTDKGLSVCQPEFLAVFSLDMFDDKGKTSNGHTYEQVAAWWQQLGGKQLPPSPFGNDPPPPPPPPPGSGFSGLIEYRDGLMIGPAMPQTRASFDITGWLRLIQAIMDLLASGKSVPEVMKYLAAMGEKRQAEAAPQQPDDGYVPEEGD